MIEETLGCGGIRSRKFRSPTNEAALLPKKEAREEGESRKKKEKIG